MLSYSSSDIFSSSQWINLRKALKFEDVKRLFERKYGAKKKKKKKEAIFLKKEKEERKKERKKKEKLNRLKLSRYS